MNSAPAPILPTAASTKTRSRGAARVMREIRSAHLPIPAAAFAPAFLPASLARAPAVAAQGRNGRRLRRRLRGGLRPAAPILARPAVCDRVTKMREGGVDRSGRRGLRGFVGHAAAFCWAGAQLGSGDPASAGRAGIVSRAAPCWPWRPQAWRRRSRRPSASPMTVSGSAEYAAPHSRRQGTFSRKPWSGRCCVRSLNAWSPLRGATVGDAVGVI